LSIDGGEQTGPVSRLRKTLHPAIPACRVVRCAVSTPLEEIMSFYSDYGVRAYRPRISHYFLTFRHHISEYVNSTLVRSIDFSQIVWC
jgi:hypothetical protein